MTDRLRRLAWAAPLVVLLTACTDDSGPLAEDQLPGEVVETESSTRGAPTATSCTDLNEAQQRVAVSAGSDADDPARYWTYRLEDGTWVAVHVMEVAYPFADPDEALAEIRTAIEACAAESDDVQPLDDAPADSVGYRSTTSDSNGTREAETLVATAGERVVTVVASHDEGTEASVDVREVLDDVRDRAADIDLG